MLLTFLLSPMSGCFHRGKAYTLRRHLPHVQVNAIALTGEHRQMHQRPCCQGCPQPHPIRVLSWEDEYISLIGTNLGPWAYYGHRAGAHAEVRHGNQ